MASVEFRVWHIWARLFRLRKEAGRCGPARLRIGSYDLPLLCFQHDATGCDWELAHRCSLLCPTLSDTASDDFIVQMAVAQIHAGQIITRKKLTTVAERCKLLHVVHYSRPNTRPNGSP